MQSNFLTCVVSLMPTTTPKGKGLRCVFVCGAVHYYTSISKETYKPMPTTNSCEESFSVRNLRFCVSCVVVAHIGESVYCLMLLNYRNFTHTHAHAYVEHIEGLIGFS